MNPRMKANAFTYEAGDVKLYLIVEDANERSYHDSERGNVTDLEPRIRVTTGTKYDVTNFPAIVEPTVIKVRGRKYTTDTVMTPAEHVIVTDDDSGWDREWKLKVRGWVTASGGDGHRNDQGVRVDYKAKADETLDGIVRDACIWLDETYPWWRTESCWGLYEYKIRREEYEIERATETIRKANEKIVKLRDAQCKFEGTQA